MQRYFANKVNKNIILGDGDVHHLLHVMRAKKGDEIEAVADNKLYACIIDSLTPLVIKVNYEIPTDSELNEEVTLFFALAKGEKIDFVVQKATELGANKIVLLKTERCVVKFDDKTLKHKLERFEKIAKEAINAIADKIKNLNTLNIIVAGKTGVGKSTLINSVFKEKLADTGMGTPVTTVPSQQK